jgi:hypothetical protein
MSAIDKKTKSNKKDAIHVMSKDSKMSIHIKLIMEEELKAQGNPSLRKFTDWLTEGMSQAGDTVVSHTSVMNWQNGKPPATDFLEDMLSVYPVSDRRFLFALRMLAAKSPHVWGFGGVVWSLKKGLLPQER